MKLNPGQPIRRYTHLTTAETEQILAAYRTGLSIRAVADQVGRSYGAVHRALAQAGVERRSRGHRVEPAS